MEMRAYDHSRDHDAVRRIWREVGWIDDTNETQVAALRSFYGVGTSWVTTIDDVPECAVHTTSGAYRAGSTDLPLLAVTAVTTGHLVRKRGAATGLVAEALAHGHDEGCAVAALGIFEQGYYDRFGFGTGTYDHRHSFDPGSLTVPVPGRIPVRVTVDDAVDFHALLMRRHRHRGSVVLHPPEVISAELAWLEHPFGLGYRASDGRLTHAIFGSMAGEHGPYVVEWMAYEEPVQLLELLGLLRSLEDQVSVVTISSEPPGLQLQDLLRRPIRQRNSNRLAGNSVVGHSALAATQLRILDMPACLASVEWRGDPFELVVEITDPLADRGGRWPGVGGRWVVRLGKESSAEEIGSADVIGTMPVVDASVNAFSRLWSGARPATALALTDHLVATDEVLHRLDEVFAGPSPQFDWSF